jgi:hypothetical protein
MESIFLFTIGFIIAIFYFKLRGENSNKTGRKVQGMVEDDGFTFLGWKSPSGSEWDNCPFKEANGIRVTFIRTRGIPRTTEDFKIFKYIDNGEEKIGWVKIIIPPFEKPKIKIKYI